MIQAIELPKDTHRDRYHNLDMIHDKNTPPSPGLFKARSSASDASDDTNPSSIEEDGRNVLHQIKESDKNDRIDRDRLDRERKEESDEDTIRANGKIDTNTTNGTLDTMDTDMREENNDIVGKVNAGKTTSNNNVNSYIKNDANTYTKNEANIHKNEANKHSKDNTYTDEIDTKIESTDANGDSENQITKQSHIDDHGSKDTVPPLCQSNNSSNRVSSDATQGIFVNGASNNHSFQSKKSVASSKPSIVSTSSQPLASIKLVRLEVDTQDTPVAPAEPIFSDDYAPVVSTKSYFEKQPSPTSSQVYIPRAASSRPPQALSSESLRRHTAPVHHRDDRRSSYDSKRSFEHRRSFLLVRLLRQARNTFPQHSEIKPDSTNNEILRMRNSIIVKRSQKKKRYLEDDKVLVGNKISEGHENFVLAYNMLTGIRVAVSRCSGVMQKLKDEDFRSSKKLTFNMDGSEMTPSSKYDFKFKDYCPEVFRELRLMFGLDPADYLVSITGKYILSELGSPGKSGSFFYYSRDFRFIIKTIHHSEHKQLRKILKHYYEHVKENPNTLISQFYGLHRVKMPFSQANGRSKKVHFVVMNNLFPPHRDIHLKYDLKGSTWGRSTNVALGADISQLTLKDMDWLNRKDTIKFGPEKKKLFFEQLESDVKLLKKINVMDYSLLLGIHDVKMGNTFDLSQKLLVFDPKSLDKSELIKTNPRDIDPENDLPSNVFPGRLKLIFYGHDGGIRATGEQNEPLQEIYYLGIIDCLTNYGLKKRLETFWRTIGHARLTVLAIPSGEYGDRFLAFIKRGTKSKKD